jgi:hypothetical protein
MTFNTTGWQKAVVTVIVPGDLTKRMSMIVTLEASYLYPNMTMPIVLVDHGFINLEPHHSLELTYQFLNKDQSLNTVEFSVKNKGNAEEYLSQYYLPSYSDYTLNIDFETTNTCNPVYPNGPTCKVIMNARYRGSKYPMIYNIEVVFYTEPGISGYTVSANITISFIALARTQQTYLFVGTIGAFIIVMAVVLAVVLRRPGKGKK